MSDHPGSSVVLAGATLHGRAVDVTVAGGTVVAVAPAGAARPRGAALVVEAGGGALLPGLHDHHLHLLAAAAARASVDVAGADLDRAVAGAHDRLPPDRWLRVVGYDEGYHGPLDRLRLDALAPGRPVRVQHRSGALWVLSTAALDRLPLDALDADRRARDVEAGADGQPTGRLFRLDGWLGRHLPRAGPPDLAPVGRSLAAAGVTGVTDATPTTDPAEVALLAEAARAGTLPVVVAVTGGPALAGAVAPPPLVAGPVKVVVADHALPDLDELTGWFAAAHRAGRSVAVHCVTEVALALALAAWDATGARPGDRVEHASVARPAHLDRLRAHRLTVVTQPGFVHAHGDRYLREVPDDERPHLYRCGSLLAVGVPVAASTDAPFGPADPWRAMAAAVTRTTAAGRPLGPGERVSPRQALNLFLAPLTDPGGPPRAVTVGGPADLCLLDRPLPDALAALAAGRPPGVVATLAGGAVTFAADDPSG